MEFKIRHTWDGVPVMHEPVCVRLHPQTGGVMLEVMAPLFNDPPAPAGASGEPFNGLWDYEGEWTRLLAGLGITYIPELCHLPKGSALGYPPCSSCLS